MRRISAAVGDGRTLCWLEVIYVQCFADIWNADGAHGLIRVHRGDDDFESRRLSASAPAVSSNQSRSPSGSVQPPPHQPSTHHRDRGIPSRQTSVELGRALSD